MSGSEILIHSPDDTDDALSERSPIDQKKRRFVVLVIDPLKLRRCCVTQALSVWMRNLPIKVRSIPPSDLPRREERKASYDLAILNIGKDPVSKVAERGIIRRILSDFEGIPLILLSERTDRLDAIDAFHHGAKGIIQSDGGPDLVLNVISFVLNGGTYFPPAALEPSDATEVPHPKDEDTPPKDEARSSKDVAPAELRIPHCDFTERQNDVLGLLQKGLPNKVIGRQLGMTEATVKVHVRQIMRKLGVSNRTQAVVQLNQINARLQQPMLQ